jgi:uncharacterized protein (TIGR04255 family)
MLFPESPRVIYNKNPLVEVICQLRFPRILRIDTDLPTAFQEEIRAAFPNFTQSAAIDLGKLPPDLARIVGLEKALGSGQQSYEFSSADGTWKVTLTSQFLALVTTKYRRWEEFKERLGLPLQALARTYGPTFFSRLGLRYQDVIKRSELGLSDVAWSELLQPHILAELSKPGIEAAAVEVARNLLLQIGDQGDKVRVQHGFAKTGQDPEKCYLIDCDFFVEQQTEPNNATAVLDRLNRESGRLFRWCIESRLHEAMEPRSPE